MNTMKMPGFTAEACLYRSSNYYETESTGIVGRGATIEAALMRQGWVVTGSPGVAAIQPQLLAQRAGGGLAATCGQCNCDPGQCCEADSKGCKCTNCGPTPPKSPFPNPYSHLGFRAGFPPIVW